jgi:glutamate-1-semialdehyde 2,1-aminomutase
LKLLQNSDFYAKLNEKSAFFGQRLTEIAANTGVPVTLNRVGSMMTGFFTDSEVVDFESAMLADVQRYAVHYRQMLSRGVYLAPSQFEVAFISAAQSEKELETALELTEWSFKKMLEM